MKDIYWLGDKAEIVVAKMDDKRTHWGALNNSPFRQAWLRNYIAYYSPVLHPSSWDSSLIFEGVQGELVRMYTPKARSYIRQVVGIVTKQRLAVQAMCQTDGKEVVEDVKLANALADQIIQNQRLDMKADKLVEGALVTGCSFFKTMWRTDLGVPYTRDDLGRVIMTGGVEISAMSVFDVLYDITFHDWDQIGWAEARTIKNRWDLVAQHPELTTQILSLPAIKDTRSSSTWFDSSVRDDDLVYVYELFCRPSAALPKGRLLVYGDSKTVFTDGDNPTGTIPIEPMMPEAVLGTGLGYPQFTNILAAQEMYDNSLSAIATNQSQFAVQSVTVARGANLNVQSLNGMQFISFTPQNVPGGGKPEPLQLTQSSPETFKFSEVLDKAMQDMSGANGALRGNLPPGVTSGVAIATLSANALEFTEAVSKPFRLCFEKTMWHALNAYAKFAKLPQDLEMKNSNNKVSKTVFTGAQLKNISAVKVITANPLMQTVSGRLEIGEKLMQMPRDLWPMYVSILEGRPLSDIYKTELSQEDLINSENEDLMQGEDVPILITDDHPVHIRDHQALLNDPAIRRNGPAVGKILSHIAEHEELAQQIQMQNPQLLAMLRTGKMGEVQQAQQVPPPPGGPSPLAEPEPERAQPAQDPLQRGIA